MFAKVKQDENEQEKIQGYPDNRFAEKRKNGIKNDIGPNAVNFEE